MKWSLYKYDTQKLDGEYIIVGNKLIACGEMSSSESKSEICKKQSQKHFRGVELEFREEASNDKYAIHSGNKPSGEPMCEIHFVE